MQFKWIRAGVIASAMSGVTIVAHAQDAAQNEPAPNTRPADAEVLEEVTVTTGRVTQQAPDSVAVSVLQAAEVQQLAPASAADLLRTVPGVFVNSALGEIRNVVYSRGISANSTEAAAGYYYVSLQEDGLPVTNVTFNNYGPDFFYRQDLSFDRLEALRGGTASVTGPNAPGGIFNYISRTGLSDPSVEVRTRMGLEGDGRNLYSRGDFFAGGQIGERDLYYSVGGFYRRSEGSRDPGYPMNRGGQIKANLLWDYGAGRVQMYGKYLDDHNAFNEFLPARNFNDPQLIDGIFRFDSFLIPRSPHSFVKTIDSAPETWDGRRIVHNEANAIGVRNDHAFGEGWSIQNDLKYSDNKASWNSSALTFAVPITDFFSNILLNATAPGLYSYRDHNTGALLAQVQVAGPARTVVLNNLPNQQVVAGGVLTQVAFNFNPSVKEVMDQFSISKEFDRASFKLGAFFANSEVSQSGGGAGIGFATIQDQPSMLDITLTTPGGVTQQVTSPEGFAGIGQRFLGTPTEAKQRQVSVFLGSSWKATDQLIFDGALRYDRLRNSGVNSVFVPNPQSVNPTYGGLDGNANTLFDNFAGTYITPASYKYDLDYMSFSGAATYEFDSASSVYARYSKGKKAPDLTFFQALDTAAEINNLQPVPQKIDQLEVGYKYRADRFRVALTPFYSKLGDVGSAQLGSRADGTAYVPPTLFSTTKTYGVEIEGDVDLGSAFNLRTALTLQDSKSSDFAIWVFNTPGEADDVISAVPDGDADNAAKVMATTTLRFAPTDRLSSFATWRYMGERAANRYNSFYLPAYSEVDLGATFNLSDNLSVGANVNNLFNEEGVLSFAPAGSLLGALDRQALTPAQIAANPNQNFSILLNQPRSYFVTVGYRF